MGFGDIAGKCWTDPNAPRGQAVCDYGGEWVQLHKLRKQMQWFGNALKWTGYLVCDEHYDQPQAQLKPIRLPPDPVPLKNPRPEVFVTINRPQGFTAYVMWAGGTPLNFAVVLMDGTGQPILTNTGEEILLEIGSDGPALLAQLVEMTGIPVPGDIQDYNGVLQTAGVAQQLIPASASRTYIAIFNPCTAPIFVNTGVAVPGVPPSISIGSGGCLFWATQQGFGAPWPGAMTVVGNIPNVPYYAYAN